MNEIIGWCFGCRQEVPWLRVKAGRDRRHRVLGSTRGERITSSLCYGPVWPGVRVRDQGELEAEIGSLLVIRSPIQSPGRWMEWVPGRGRLDLQDYLPRPLFHCSKCGRELSGFDCDVCGQLLSDMPTNETAGVDWLRIAPAEDSNHPVPDISDIRYVVEQCLSAKVPIWIESLLCTIGGGWMFPRVADPAEWPEDLRGCRELPEVKP